MIKDYNAHIDDIIKLQDNLFGVDSDSVTPSSAVELCLDRINFNNLQMKILDPACGHGSFLIGAFKKFFNSRKHRSKFPNPRQRIKYIIENQIYGNDIQARKTSVFESFIKSILPEVKINIENLNFLHYNSDMEFDAITTNPPYQDDSTGKSTKTTNLYVPFFRIAERLIKPNGTISMIIPSDWVGPNNSIFKKYLFNSNKLKEIELHPYQKYFKVKKETCNIIFDKSYNGKCRFTDTKGVSNLINLKEHKFLSRSNDDAEYRKIFEGYSSMGYRWLRGKLNLNKIKEVKKGVEFIEACGRSTGPLITKTIHLDLENTGYGLNGLVLPNVGDGPELGKNIKIKKKNQVGGHSVVFLVTDSKKEKPENLLKFLRTKPIVELIKRIKKSSPNSKVVFNQIPDIDLSIEWDDKKVYKFFNFDKEQIKYVENSYDN